MTNRPLISIQNLSFSYRDHGRSVPVLHDLSFDIYPGEFVAIIGPSGSGKSTLFYLLGCVLKPAKGLIKINDQDISKLSDLKLSVLRNKSIGFVFQQFHLLPQLTLKENILLPDHFPVENKDHVNSAERFHDLTERLGIASIVDRYPNQVSGGQQQRVAIARALIHDVDLVLADEPTGNLDSQNANQTMDILKSLHKAGKTVVLITHDRDIAAQCQRQIVLKDGKCVEDTGPVKNLEPSTSSQRGPETIAVSSWKEMVRAILPESLFSIRTNKVRTLLTMIGVTVGVAAIVSMLTFARFTKSKVMESYESLGANKLSLRGFTNWNMRASGNFKVLFREFDWDKDIVPFLKAFPDIQKISPVRWSHRSNRISFGGKTISENRIDVTGVNADYLTISNRKVIQGRALSVMDVENRNSVCMIGTEIREKLFPDINPIGNILTLSTEDLALPCRVVGVLEPKSSNKEWEKPNLDVILPHTYLLPALPVWNRNLYNVVMQASMDADIEALAKNIRKYFQTKYENTGEFYVGSDSVLIAQMRKFLNLFTLLLGAIAAITLVVGGIGIHNMMLVSLNERIKEIGLRRALGATQRSIGLQLLLESLLICGIAGLAGVTIGFICYEAMIFGVAKFSDKVKFEWTADPLALTFGLVAIVTVGVLSGLGPSRKAAQLDVIEALRKD